MTSITRETWLTTAASYFLDNLILPECSALPAPTVRIAMGWPKGSRGGKKAIGQCWTRAQSGDGTNEIFICPTIADSQQVLSTLIHELIHATDDCKSGHKNHFAKVARSVGLEGKLTATTAGADLTELLSAYVADHGEIPHTAMIDDPGKKKPGSRMIKIECASCGFVARTASKWIEQMQENACCPICQNNTLNHESV